MRPVRVEEVHGLQVVPSHTRTVLPGTDVEVYHELGHDLRLTYSRPPTVGVWEQPREPVLSSERP
jgi:hypothetical protein